MHGEFFDHLGAGKSIEPKKLWQQNANDNLDNPTTIPNQMNPQKNKPNPVQNTEPDPLDIATDSQGSNKNSFLNVFDF